MFRLILLVAICLGMSGCATARLVLRVDGAPSEKPVYRVELQVFERTE